jgi:hypothetical protein
MMNQLSSDDHKVRTYEVPNRTATKVVDASDYRHVLKIDNDVFGAKSPADTTGDVIWWAASETTPMREINLRDTAGVYHWNAGDGGTDDFFLREKVGGGDPTATVKAAASTERPWPDEVYANDVLLERIEFTAIATITQGQWAWGRATGDGLGYDTIYLRLPANGSVDPENHADNYVKARWVTDHMERLPAGSKQLQDGAGTAIAPIWIYQQSNDTMWTKVCARTS